MPVLYGMRHKPLPKASGGGKVLSPRNNLIGPWSMKNQVSGDGALWDPSRLGHHGWFGGVKKAVIADTTSGDRGLSCPGIAGNYASVPDFAGNRPTGDLWMYADMRVVDFSTAATQAVLARWTITGNQRCEQLSIATSGAPTLLWTTDGTAGTLVTATATATMESVVANGTRVQLYATVDVDDGASHYLVKFWWRVPGGVWAQLGNTVTGGATTSVHPGTAITEIGTIAVGTAAPLGGTIYAASMGTGLVLDTGTTLSVDFTTQAQGTRSFICSTGQVVTINTAGSSTAEPIQLFHGGTTHGWLPGSAGNYFSVPDEAALDIVGDIDLRCRLSTPDWTPSSLYALMSKWITTGDQRAWRFLLLASGYLRISSTTDGTAATEVVSTSSATLATVDGTVTHVRVALDVNDGAGNRVARFYTSTDGSTWTQLGTDVTTAGVTTIAATTAIVEIGAYSNSGNMLGSYYAAQIYSGIAGTKVLDIDFTQDALYNATQTTLTAVSGQEVTINRSATGLKSTVVDSRNVEAGDGVDDYDAVDDNDRLDFTATESLTLAKRVRIFSSPAAEGVLIGKKSGISTAGAGYQITIDTSRRAVFRVSDGTNVATATSAALTVGASVVITGVLNRSTGTVTVYVDGVASTTGDASAVGSLANAVQLRSGSDGSGANFFAWQSTAKDLFRRALTAAQVLRLNREM